LERKPTKGLGGKEPNMLIIGCDYHPGFQQIAFVDTETGECGERRLTHRAEAEQFYRTLKERSLRVRVGMEASGHGRWFEGLLSELQFELWMGDAAEIRTKRVRKQKTDRQDAQLLLKLMVEDRFPRIWVADAENRDAATVVASPPVGADAHPGNESAACCGSE
jgi:transposase